MAVPHVPTEAELEQKRHGTGDGRDDERGYQARSVGSVGSRARQAAWWVKDRLSGFHVTLARLSLALGLLGLLYTWGKNKKKRTWLALTVISCLLTALGLGSLLLGG